MMFTLVVRSFAADAAPTDPSTEWDVSAPHGPTHDVTLDLDEGTWMSVTVAGDKLVFDLLGDLWSIPLGGGEATRLTSGPAWDTEPQASPDGARIAFTSDRGGNENVWVMNADGTGARAVTDEDEARCTDPVWDPTGPYLLVRHRTVDTRSIGVTEIWQHHLDGGDGFALTALADHPHAGEATALGRYLWFSSRHGRFEYDADAVAGLWDVVRLDRRTGDLRPAVSGPGSASRPTVSADGAHLWFVSRERERTVLERLTVATGARIVADPDLSPDELEAFALHGTYPRIALAPNGDPIYWAHGKLWRLDATTLVRTEIPFHLDGTWTLHDVTRWPHPITDTVAVKSIRWPTLSSRGSLAFSAVGALWVRTPDGELSRVSEGTGYAPAWSPDGKSLAWTSWDDETGGHLHVTGPGGQTDTLPVQGQLTNPAWSDDGRELVVLRGAGGLVPGADLSAEPWYEIVHLRRDGILPPPGRWVVSTVRAIDGQYGARKTRLALHDGRVWFFEFRDGEPREPPTAVLMSVALDGTDPIDHLKLGHAEEVAISPDFGRVAYKLDHQLYVSALPAFAREVEREALPATQVTKVVGDWIGWSPDGAEVTWVQGAEFARLPVSDLWAPEEEGEEEEDEDWFAEDPRIVKTPIGLELPRSRPGGYRLLTHARVIPMTGDAVLDDVNVLIAADRIVEIGPGVTHPDAEVIDCTGKTIVPGLIDVHAHLHYNASDVLREQDWTYLTALDFGVTTVHDPSANTDLVFTKRERVEAGFERGPRVASTGFILYGAHDAAMADTPSLDAARAHVRRMKAVGATSVKVYQQSQRERRQWYAQVCVEEQILCVPEGGGDLWMDLGMAVDGYHAIEHALEVTPLYRDVIGLLAGTTGGSGDGYGTFHTPTLQVAYGGVSGKQWWIQHANPVDDARLRRHFPTRLLEADLWRGEVTAHDDDWRARSTARDDATLQDAGGHVTLGAHGELQGLGVHWELWGLGGWLGPTRDPGGMEPIEALRAATIEGARYLGLDGDLGTVEVGKLADLLVLDADPLADLHATTRIAFVVKNGEVVR
ncbi:MAG: amidohydrolase family protein [Myxococcota bacterium]